MSRVRRALAWAHGPGEPDEVAAGVTRFDLICSAQTTETVQKLTRRWCEDRALSSSAVDRLVMLVRAAVGHGLRFAPGGVTLMLRWLDVDRVRIDVRWYGCRATARLATAESDLESTAAALDVLAENWGFATSRTGPVQWMVVDTR